MTAHNPLQIARRVPTPLAPGVLFAAAFTFVAFVVAAGLAWAFGPLGFGIAVFSSLLPLLLLWQSSDLPL